MTPEMLRLMLLAAQGNLGLLFALIALRLTERGGPGREMGILDVGADTQEKQIHYAANTWRHKERMFQDSGRPARDQAQLYTEAFLDFFSSLYAPIGVENDPHGLNRNHARNLKFFYARCQRLLGEMS